MNKEITIAIYGRTATGKSGLMVALYNMLTALDLNVELHEKESVYSSEDINSILNSLNNRQTKINIVECRTNREGQFGDHEVPPSSK